MQRSRTGTGTMQDSTEYLRALTLGQKLGGPDSAIDLRLGPGQPHESTGELAYSCTPEILQPLSRFVSQRMPWKLKG